MYPVRMPFRKRYRVVLGSNVIAEGRFLRGASPVGRCAWCPGSLHRLDANPFGRLRAGSGQALGVGLTRAEEHAGLATRHFELAISSRPLRLNLHHTHLAEGVMPKTAGCPRSRGGRDLGDIRGCTGSWNVQKLKLLDLTALPK